MVQYKKDDIKEKIDKAALTVFAEKGYRNTKISDIADCAGVSVGNIYRYYNSKATIFHTIVPESFFASVKQLLYDKIFAAKNKKIERIEEIDQFWMVNHEVIRFMVENRERMLIVFQRSQGTKFENAKEALVDFLIKIARDHFITQHNQLLGEDTEDVVLKVIYENLMHMTLRILEETKDLNQVIRRLKSINSYHLFGITSLFQ
ncbi:TetR/AcrR family transcriptional regulator [Clostridiaceae bacterium 35-E11]